MKYRPKAAFHQPAPLPRRQADASPPGGCLAEGDAPPQAVALRSAANGVDAGYQHGDERFVERHGFVEHRSVGFVPASSDIEPSDDFDRRASCETDTVGHPPSGGAIAFGEATA